MKVLEINSVCGKGSTGRIATDIYDILKEQGHSCKVLYGRDNAQRMPEEDTIPLGSKWTVRIHGVLSRLTGKHGFYSKRATRRAIEKIKEFDPDVIHLHNIHGYWIHIGELFHYLKESGKPVVWTLHDCWSFTGQCSHFEYCDCEKWKSGCESCPQIGEYPKSFRDNSRWNYQKKREIFTSLENLTLVTPSRWLADLVKQSYLKQYPVTAIPNGIDLSVFRAVAGKAREKYGFGDRRIYLAVASIWTERKGYLDLLSLAGRLTPEERLVLVGVSQKQKENLPENVIGICRTDSVEELAEIYSRADCLLNTTYEDTFPTVNIEALACGTPVITYQTGGSPEAIDDSCGKAVKQRDWESLLQEARHSNFSTEACVARAEKFEKEKQYANYVAIYQDVAR